MRALAVLVVGAAMTLMIGVPSAYADSSGREETRSVVTTSLTDVLASGVGVSSSSGASFPSLSNKGAAYYSTQYTYGKYICRYGVASQIVGYNVYPIAFSGGGSYTTASNTISTTSVNCAPISNGVTAYKTSGVTLTWTGGVSLASKIGIDLTSQSKYSASVKVSVKATSSGRKWCGQLGAPGSTDGAIQVQ